MHTIKKTSVFKGTWMDIKGTSTTHHLDSKSTGLRIHCLELVNNSVVVVKLIKGDGRHCDGSFKIISETWVPRDEVDAAVQEFLTHNC